MNKKKLLYVILFVYLIVIFIPLNIMFYFPNSVPFKLPFMQSVVEEPLVEEVLVESPTSPAEVIIPTLPRTEPLTTTGVSATDIRTAFSQLERVNYVSYNDAEKLLILTSLDGNNKTITFNQNTVFLCLDPRYRNSPDMFLASTTDEMLDTFIKKSGNLNFISKIDIVDRYGSSRNVMDVAPLTNGQYLLTIYFGECAY